MADIVDPFEQSAQSKGIVDPFEKPAGDGFSWSKTYQDIPKEIGNEASAGASDVAALAHRGEMGPIEGLLSAPKAAIGALRTVASPITGAARSLVGHGMANLEHAAGTVINPEVAAKDNPEQMYETAKGDVDTAMSAARPGGAPIKVAGAYEWKPPSPAPTKPVGIVKQPETEDFFDAAENHYSNMRGFGVEINPAAMNGVADNILTELHAEGYRPRNAPKVFDAVDELRNPAGQNHEISDIDSVRKVLGKARLDPSERDAARRAVGHIDDYLANLGNNPQDVVVNPHFAGRVAEEATSARANYAVAKRSEDIDEAMDKAQRQAGRAGAGGNINNAIRQQLSSLRNNRKKMAGWTDAEKAELDAVISGSASANTARQAGKFAPHGIVSTVMSAGAGHMIAPGIGEVAVPAAGWIAKKIGDRLTKTAAERLSNVVKARSPLGRQTAINAAAQSAFAPSASRPPMLSTGVVAALPHSGAPMPTISGLLPSRVENDQNPTAGFARGGNVNTDSGKTHSANGRSQKAVMRAIRASKGYADGGDVSPSSPYYDQAKKDLDLNDKEQALYERHLNNLNGLGGVDNPNGSRSSLYQSVQEHNGKYYNVPTVWNGQRETEQYTKPDTGETFDVPNQTALQNIQKEGWDTFPSYNTPEEADQRYDQMHQYMEKDTSDYLANKQQQVPMYSRGGSTVGNVSGEVAYPDEFTDIDRLPQTGTDVYNVLGDQYQKKVEGWNTKRYLPQDKSGPLRKNLPPSGPLKPEPDTWNGDLYTAERKSGGRVAAEKALPVNHQLGMRVPKGGSNCAKCKFLKSPTECGNAAFVKWNGSAKLPAPANRYCCDLYERAHGFASGGALKTAYAIKREERAS